MSRSSNYYIVEIPFTKGVEFYGKGTAVDTTGWDNIDSFLASGYLRSPYTIEEWELIVESARGFKRDPFSVLDKEAIADEY